MISRASLHGVLAEGHVTERSLPHRYGKSEMTAEKDAVVFRRGMTWSFPDVRPAFVTS
jgi:hypothetical protein